MKYLPIIPLLFIFNFTTGAQDLERERLGIGYRLSSVERRVELATSAATEIRVVTENRMTRLETEVGTLKQLIYGAVGAILLSTISTFYHGYKISRLEPREK